MTHPTIKILHNLPNPIYIYKERAERDFIGDLKRKENKRTRSHLRDLETFCQTNYKECIEESNPIHKILDYKKKKE